MHNVNPTLPLSIKYVEAVGFFKARDARATLPFLIWLFQAQCCHLAFSAGLLLSPDQGGPFPAELVRKVLPCLILL